MLERCIDSYEYQPSQDAFCNEAQDYVDSFAVKVVLPPSDAFVLQHHVDCEDVEQNKVDEQYQVHKCGNVLRHAAYGCDEISVYRYPGCSA